MKPTTTAMRTEVIGLDPGPEKSAVVMIDAEGIWQNVLHYRENDFILHWLKGPMRQFPLVIEKIASFGMPVGADVFETVYWSGRFAEAYGAEHVYRITRGEVKMHLCQSMRAKDSNIRQSLIDRFGKPGTKKNPGKLFGISGDLWSALAVAVTFWDQHNKQVLKTGTT